MSSIALGTSSSSSSSRDLFISASANRYSHIADWASLSTTPSTFPTVRDDESISILAYGSNRSIALSYNLGESSSNYRGISELLSTPFTSSVTCLKFFHTNDARRVAFLAGAGNGQAAIWVGTYDETSSKEARGLWKPISWKMVAEINIKGAGTVQAIGVLRDRPDLRVKGGFEDKEATLAVGTSNGEITIWSLPYAALQEDQASSSGSSQLSLLQTITASKADLNKALPLDIAFALLPSKDSRASSLLMATACTDRKIVFWVKEESDHFVKALTLPGHDDWVRSLDFSAPFPLTGSSDGGSQFNLASAGQDGSVRLWRLRPSSSASVSNETTTSAKTSQAACSQSDAFDLLAKQVEDEASQQHDSTGSYLSNKTHLIETRGAIWSINFDALLTGHESWVTGARWQPPMLTADGQSDQGAALLSASVDNSIILWTPSELSAQSSSTNSRLTSPSLSTKEATSSLWLPSQRFGELGVAGAGALGMFGALWSPHWHHPTAQQTILSHAWAGAVHLWAHDQETRKWETQPAITGHGSAVKSARWSPEGDWFLTASLDRTARLFGEFVRSSSSKDSSLTRTWHELARPQTHGYDICSAAWLDDLSFASAADEKVARIFAAPQGFVQTVQRLGANKRLAMSTDGRSQKRNRWNVLAVNLPTADHARNLRHLEGPITTAVQQTCSSKHKRLLIVLCSTLFDNLNAGYDSSSLSMSFKEVESLLAWCYGRAWAAAVQKDDLLIDVDVLLCGDGKAPSLIRDLGSEEGGAQYLWAVKEPSAMLPFLLSQKPRAGATLYPEFLRPSQSSAATATGSSTSEDSEVFPRQRVIALGGTFDHLHVGHKIFLSMAALIATERIIVGVTGDSMLAKKTNLHLLEPIEERIAAVDDFIRRFRATMMSPLKQDVVPLADVCGPAGSETDLQALLVTEETISGADFIAKTRDERGLGALERYVIGVVGAQGENDVKGEDAAALAAAKVGSTGIRKWLDGQSAEVQATLRRRRKAEMRRQRQLQSGGSAMAARPMAASVPALGLSNRAIFEGESAQEEVNELGRAVPPQADQSPTGDLVLHRPPVEEELLVSTLWPELDKLYGHGYELLTVDTSPVDESAKVDGKNKRSGSRYIATTCKSTTPEHSLVRIYDGWDNWREVAALKGHSLSITRVRFSLDGNWILTVSRDRSWRLYRLAPTSDTSSEEVQFVDFASKEGAHARILWDATWSLDSRTFATASRDKSVKVWRIASSKLLAAPSKEAKDDEEEKVELMATVSRLPDAVTALAFDVANRLAVGLENGDVYIYQYSASSGSLEKVVNLERHHALPVNELSWRPLPLEEEEEDVEEIQGHGLLLSAGEDGAVRLVEV